MILLCTDNNDDGYIDYDVYNGNDNDDNLDHENKDDADEDDKDDCSTPDMMTEATPTEMIVRRPTSTKAALREQRVREAGETKYD